MRVPPCGDGGRAAMVVVRSRTCSRLPLTAALRMCSAKCGHVAQNGARLRRWLSPQTSGGLLTHACTCRERHARARVANRG
eukprot:5193371-Prymnesium_polylepis.1